MRKKKKTKSRKSRKDIDKQEELLVNLAKTMKNDTMIEKLSGPFILDIKEDYKLDFCINNHELINDAHRELITLCEETLLVINSLNALNVRGRMFKWFLADKTLDSESKSKEESSDSETKRNRKKCYFNRLVDNASAGLETTHSMPGLAKSSILKLQEEIMIREGGIIRNNYLTKLGLYVVLFTFLALLVWSNVQIKDSLVKMSCLVWIGSMIGLWVNAFSEKMQIEFKELATIEQFRIYPALKLIYVGLCTLILMLFLRSDLVGLSIGELTMIKVSKLGELQLLLGVIAGALEGSFIKRLFEQTGSIFMTAKK